MHTICLSVYKTYYVYIDNVGNHTMSGHSKWSTIKHKKAATDVKRGKVFSKIAHLITVESRLVGGDANSPSLKTLIQKAKAENMPKENIERAIAKGVGAGGASEQITYELYGPQGVAILLDVYTDNRNRTVSELKHLLSKLGYQLAEPGAAMWAFEKDGAEWKPTTLLPLEDDSQKEKLTTLIEALEEYDDIESIYTNAS
ncbi:MAG: transcriptional regulator [Parcubacteria group bacterium GW2011_GWD2_42_14]|nr:MAG: transcriptional regulator [Parcubacteria group bacterium GW2011_GWD2_42_14]